MDKMKFKEFAWSRCPYGYSMGATGLYIRTEDMVKLIGKEFSPFIHSMGSIPVRVSFDGDSKKQTLFAQALTDRYNFITPLDFDELKDRETSLQAVVDFKENRIKIKNTGLNIRNITVDEKGKEIITYDPVLDINGTIEGDFKERQEKGWISGGNGEHNSAIYIYGGHHNSLKNLNITQITEGHFVINLSIPKKANPTTTNPTVNIATHLATPPTPNVSRFKKKYG